ncbi:DUF932 domain-containing protein [Pseudonocardia pini]|uniref:DUF932 domain-containing protein n=1 Tax=Pseudonocardia pini TaxID=2758030 RepID=UPI0015F033E5|nr:DUF932 domain-containing protein [Pseudonocardia pini]
MQHYRDSKGGAFHLAPAHELRPARPSFPPFLRFCETNGAGVGDLLGSAPSVESTLARAKLDWEVDSRPVYTDSGDDHALVSGYRALVRPLPETVMSVVSSSYRVAENRDLAGAVLGLAKRYGADAGRLGAASFGRNRARTYFAYRVIRLDEDEMLMLLVQNRHGGEGAVRVRAFVVNVNTNAVLAPPAIWSSHEIAHTGDMQEKLDLLRVGAMVDRFLEETESRRWQLKKTEWKVEWSAPVLTDLWEDPPNPERPGSHPGRYLAAELGFCNSAYDAFGRICAFLDNESEACERGDFTKDRDERLALGAGTKLKEKAWRRLVEVVT